MGDGDRNGNSEAIQALEALQEGIVLFDSEGRVLVANAWSRRAFMGDGEAVGSVLGDVLAPEYAAISDLAHNAIVSDRPQKGLFTVPHEEREWVGIQAAVRPTGEKGRYLLRMGEFHPASETMMEVVQEEKLASLGLLAAGVAHEFNNIWAGICGYAELAKQNPDFGNFLIDAVLQQSNRAQEIIHALLSFSTSRRLVRQPTQLGDILRAILRISELEFRSKGVEVDLEIRDDPPISGNPGMLQQVFLHLVANAFQAIPDEGRVSIRLERDDSWMAVRISDTGVGMESDQLQRLFMPFFTTKGAFGGSATVDGKGLGLTLAYNFVRLHAGQILASSTPGEGTVFVVKLPVKAPEGLPPLKRPAPMLPRRLRGGPSRRVLVVEDDATMAAMLRRLVNQHGGTCEVVSDGERALELLKTKKFDLALLDLVIPGKLDGLDVAGTIRAADGGTAVYLMTGHPDDPRVDHAGEQVRGVLIKPFHIEEVERLLADPPPELDG